MSHRTLTVAVPDALYDQLARRARERQRSVEDEVVLTLASAVPAEDESPTDLAATIGSLASLDDRTLWRLARSRVAAYDARRLAELGDKRQRAGLSAGELQEAEELIQRHDRVMVVRAEAAALLQRRGHDINGLFADA